jgi:hypothetical protein
MRRESVCLCLVFAEIGESGQLKEKQGFGEERQSAVKNTPAMPVSSRPAQPDAFRCEGGAVCCVDSKARLPARLLMWGAETPRSPACSGAFQGGVIARRTDGGADGN